jgi:DNA-binding CsgD family transcriptional regulator
MPADIIDHLILSARELEIYHMLVIHGYSPAKISVMLGLSARTVHKTIFAIKYKKKVGTLHELVVQFYSNFVPDKIKQERVAKAYRYKELVKEMQVIGDPLREL